MFTRVRVIREWSPSTAPDGFNKFMLLEFTGPGRTPTTIQCTLTTLQQLGHAFSMMESAPMLRKVEFNEE